MEGGVSLRKSVTTAAEGLPRGAEVLSGQKLSIAAASERCDSKMVSSFVRTEQVLHSIARVRELDAAGAALGRQVARDEFPRPELST